MFRRLDHPDKIHTTGGDCARSEARHKGAYVGHLMGDAYATGEEHDCAVGFQAVKATVGAFDEGIEGDLAGRRL